MATVTPTAAGLLEWAEHGEGDPCLLLHGAHGSCRDRLGTDEITAAGLRAIVPSRPGYGRTPPEVGPTAPAAADAMVALLDSLGLERVPVVAVSAGGPTGIHLAARHPDRVDALVLEAAVTGPWLADSSLTARGARAAFGPKAERVTWAAVRALSRVAGPLVLRAFLRSLSTNSPRTALGELTPAERAALLASIADRASGRGFVLDLEHQLTAEVLEQVAAPTLVLHSANDGSVPVHHARHAARHIAGSELVLLDTPCHLIWFGTGADEVRRSVPRFLRQHRGSAAGWRADPPRPR